jgi:hypothetical protein
VLVLLSPVTQVDRVDRVVVDKVVAAAHPLRLQLYSVPQLKIKVDRVETEA